MTKEQINHLAGLLRSALAASGHDTVLDLLSDWPEGTKTSSPLTPSSTLPVLSFLNDARRSAPTGHEALVAALETVAPALAWRQTYSEADLGRNFLDRYGWTMIVGPDAPVVSAHILSGFMILGPGIEYPYHKHSAEEIYKVVSGTASWRLGDDEWTPLPPGSIIHNPPWRAHGMRTDHGEPLLLAFLWRAGAIEKSVMV